MSPGRKHVRRKTTKLAKLKVATGIQSFKSIQTAGWIRQKLRLTLHEKRRLPGDTDKYEFIFIEGKSRIRGVSFGDDGKKNFDIFRVGHTHIVDAGGIKAKTRKRKFTTNSTSIYELILFKVQILSASDGPSTTYNGSVGITKIKESLAHGRKFTPFTEALENVSVEDGQVYRYLGCKTCQTRIQFQPDNYCYCKKCAKNMEEDNLMIFTMIRNLQVKDSTGKVLDGVTMFHNLCEKFLLTNANNNALDSAYRKAFTDSIGTRLKLRVEVKYNNVKRYRTHFSLIAKEMEVIWRNSASTMDDVLVADAAPLNEDPNEVITATDEQIASAVENTISSEMTVDEIIGMTIDKYELDSSPPGYTLIVNNVEFQHSRLEEREGSMRDVDNLSKLFADLKMPVYRQPFIDVTKTEFMEIIEGFKSFLTEKGAASCNVVIMSHGEQNGIEMIDESVHLYLEILPRFSDTNFPAFRSKPKFFFPLGCQQFPTGSPMLNPDHGRLPNYSDIMICLPQLPGYSAFRHAIAGSVFVKALCQVFHALADRMDFEKMLKKVAKVCSRFPIRYRRDEDSEFESHVQIPFIIPIIFSREFYYNLNGS